MRRPGRVGARAAPRPSGAGASKARRRGPDSPGDPGSVGERQEGPPPAGAPAPLSPVSLFRRTVPHPARRSGFVGGIFTAPAPAAAREGKQVRDGALSSPCAGPELLCSPVRRNNHSITIDRWRPLRNHFWKEAPYREGSLVSPPLAPPH